MQQRKYLLRLIIKNQDSWSSFCRWSLRMLFIGIGEW